MHTSFLAVTFTIALAMQVGAAEPPATQPDSSSAQFTSKELGFSFQYPRSWSATSPNRGGVVLELIPDQPKINGRAVTLIMVRQIRGGAGNKEEGIVEKQIDDLKAKFPDIRSIKIEKLTVDKKSVRRETLEGTRRGVKWKFVIVTALVESDAVNVLMMTPAIAFDDSERKVDLLFQHWSWRTEK
jgi:hypothetical protein